MDTKNTNMGLTCPLDLGELKPFVRIPFKAALEIICMGNFEMSYIFCEFLKAGYLSQEHYKMESAEYHFK